MERASLNFLEKWLESDGRKPLVIRGARQVGKTWLVRHLARKQKRQLLEINFEKKPQLASLFASNDPKEILLHLGTLSNEPIDPENCILFLDEIQAVPDMLAKLRWFAEDLPALAVIAAGSLLEFVLEKHTFSMPVGRIQYMHLEPLSFEEFLAAHDKGGLVDYLKSYETETEIPVAIHEQLFTYMKEYIIIGGMPAAISSWIQSRSLLQVNQIHHDLLATYRDDAAKYTGRLRVERLDEVMMSVPKYLGEKFVFTKVNPSIQIAAIKKSLELLCKARVCHRVIGSAANGVPLGARLQEKYTKVIFLDVGLCSASLGLSLDELSLVEEFALVNRGGISEQLVGQILRTIFPYYIEPSLYYWHREEKGSSAEIDYVVQHHSRVIPIEVKAGKTGSLKSLHLFMSLKGLPLAVRINSDLPSKTKVEVKDHQGNLIQYTLLSLPFLSFGTVASSARRG